MGFLPFDRVRSDEIQRKSTGNGELPLLQIFEGVHQKIEVNRLRAVEIIFICMRSAMLFGGQSLVEGILPDCILEPCPTARVCRISHHHKNHDPGQVQRLDNLHGHRGLSRSGTASDADDAQVLPWWRVLELRGECVERRYRLHVYGNFLLTPSSTRKKRRNERRYFVYRGYHR